MNQGNLEHIRASLSSRDWHGPDCWGCGPQSPDGLHADFRFDEDSGEVRFAYTPKPSHRGAPGYVHGGVLAAILDEAQGVLCYHLGHAVMTEQLHVKYHKATPLFDEFHVRCWITAVRRRRAYTKAELRGKDGELLVSGRGSWYILAERIVKRMFSGEFESHAHEFEVMRAVLEENRKRARKIRRRIRSAE